MEQQQSKIDINKEYLTVKEVAEHWGVRLEDRKTKSCHVSGGLYKYFFLCKTKKQRGNT